MTTIRVQHFRVQNQKLLRLLRKFGHPKDVTACLFVPACAQLQALEGIDGKACFAAK